MPPSITSWTRLEPVTQDPDMQTSLSARIFDPLWLLTRQWQMGEFQGEDAGTPVVAHIQAEATLLTRIHLGDLPPNTLTQAPAYDPMAAPLEVLVERQPVLPTGPTDLQALRFTVEAGLQFLRLLDAQPLSKSYRQAFISRFALPMPDAQTLIDLDSDTLRFLQTMAGRVPDARALELALRNGGDATVVTDPALGIAPGDRAEVRAAAQAWLDWYASFFSEPAAGADDARLPDRLEYAVSLAGRLSPDPFDERTLTAAEFYGGRLDWSSFDLNAEVRMGTDADHAVTPVAATALPAPVTFPGAPAQRFWQFEDAQVDYGLLPVGANDLAHLLLIEYATSYGNDWYVVPLTLPVGSLTVVKSLDVTDTFGVDTTLRPIGDRSLPAAYWSMWQLAYTRRPGADAIPNPEPNLFFLPPSLGPLLEGAPLENVLFMRDEMANLAWAIERVVESPIEVGVRRITDSDAGNAPVTPPAPPGSATTPSRYLLATGVPDNWIPLLPVQLPATSAGQVVSRLKRGAVLQPDGSQQVQHARGRILNADATLLLYDEEIPREGVRVSRQRRFARWLDGSSWLWTAQRKQIGRGEGASGLRFDALIDQPPAT